MFGNSVLVKDVLVKRCDRYRLSSFILIGFAALLFFAVLLTDPLGIMRNSFTLLSATSFIGGAFLFALGGGRSVDARLAGWLSMQGISTLGHIIHDLGGHGAAVFLPPNGEGGEVMQFIPTQPASQSFLGDGGGFACHNGITGTLYRPLAGPMIEVLKREDGLTLPSEYSLLMVAVREVCEDVLSIADRVDVRQEGDTVTFTLHNYLLFPGCASLRERPSELCALCPCSICGLIACMVAEGLKCEVCLDQVILDDTSRSHCMQISYILKKSEGVPT